MTIRHAACSCGQLHLTVEGESARISMCHCLECQRRTGAENPTLTIVSLAIRQADYIAEQMGKNAI